MGTEADAAAAEIARRDDVVSEEDLAAVEEQLETQS
jgi:hypothetical protein